MFDGLETLFAQNQHVAASSILKALNNRRFIYFVTLKQDYNHLKEQERKEQEEKGQCYTVFILYMWRNMQYANSVALDHPAHLLSI